MGYWSSELFPLLKSGANSIYWGGRVNSGKEGNVSPMRSGQFPGTDPNTSGYFVELKYKDKDNQVLKPDKLESTNDCKQLYTTNYYANINTILFGGTRGDASFCSS
ncbi:hypothetical protein MKX03_030614 [Papaver bracteatum]|nr:hypothetical protein MKX03_030614 [Papaver bracteatum]